MKIGVTGTRNGMNNNQDFAVWRFLYGVDENSELHHGDCVGVDTQAAEMAEILGMSVVCHPPEKNDLRAFFEKNTEVREPKSYFARNRAIVDECDLLIVVPMENERQERGGTWYTYDYAQKTGKPTKIFYPDGRIE